MQARHDYIPGGSAFTAALHESPPPPAVPGRYAVAHAPVFRMTDPHTQGVEGLVHFIGSLTGAVDTRCIQLDKWQRMSLAERSKNHVTDAAMAEVERHHDCRPPGPRVGPGVDPLTH